MAVSSDAADQATACDVCGATDRRVERTTVATIAPLEADLCAVCQLVQDHDLPDDVCMQCGEEIGTGFYVEVEFPLGEAGLPGDLSGQLCGECSGWIAHRINYQGVEADPEAHEEYRRLIGALDIDASA